MTEIEYKIVVKLMIEKLERLKDEIAEKDAEISNLTPCDVCAYNPPSSFDGKPCCVCPATAKIRRNGG